jgi:hypothetical protein
MIQRTLPGMDVPTLSLADVAAQAGLHIWQVEYLVRRHSTMTAHTGKRRHGGPPVHRYTHSDALALQLAARLLRAGMGKRSVRRLHASLRRIAADKLTRGRGAYLVSDGMSAIAAESAHEAMQMACGRWVVPLEL